MVEAALRVWLPQVGAVYRACARRLPIETALRTVLLPAADTIEQWSETKNGCDTPIGCIIRGQRDAAVFVSSMLLTLLLPDGTAQG